MRPLTCSSRWSLPMTWPGLESAAGHADAGLRQCSRPCAPSRSGVRPISRPSDGCYPGGPGLQVRDQAAQAPVDGGAELLEVVLVSQPCTASRPTRRSTSAGPAGSAGPGRRRRRLRAVPLLRRSGLADRRRRTWLGEDVRAACSSHPCRRGCWRCRCPAENRRCRGGLAVLQPLQRHRGSAHAIQPRSLLPLEDAKRLVRRRHSTATPSSGYRAG